MSAFWNKSRDGPAKSSSLSSWLISKSSLFATATASALIASLLCLEWISLISSEVILLNAGSLLPRAEGTKSLAAWPPSSSYFLAAALNCFLFISSSYSCKRLCLYLEMFWVRILSYSLAPLLSSSSRKERPPVPFCSYIIWRSFWRLKSWMSKV